MKNSNNKYKGLTLLAVLAHPDDETFGMGGTLALYARRGVSVHLICATRGEVGDVEPHFLEGYESIADLREHELRCAVANLAITREREGAAICLRAPRLLQELRQTPKQLIIGD